ncbi:MAG: CHAP domain-containing protein [Legionella sp.]|uniref:CHAP domain-containing protein n=1 Tax=Legionella sp. TaxID=459 RepID=UPI002849028A|nr:CHAP domain-containing protein [Legionella sp.]
MTDELPSIPRESPDPVIPTAKPSMASTVGKMASNYFSSMASNVRSGVATEIFGEGMASSVAGGQTSGMSPAAGSAASGLAGTALNPQHFEMQPPKQIKGESVIVALNQLNQQSSAAFSTLNKSISEGVKQTALSNQNLSKLIGTSSNIADRINKSNELLESLTDYMDKQSYNKTPAQGSAVGGGRSGQQVIKEDGTSPLLGMIGKYLPELAFGLGASGGLALALKSAGAKISGAVSSISSVVSKLGLFGGALGAVSAGSMIYAEGHGNDSIHNEVADLIKKGKLPKSISKDNSILDAINKNGGLRGAADSKREIEEHQQQIVSENKSASDINLSGKQINIKSDIIKFEAATITFSGLNGSGGGVGGGNGGQGIGGTPRAGASVVSGSTPNGSVATPSGGRRGSGSSGAGAPEGGGPVTYSGSLSDERKKMQAELDADPALKDRFMRAVHAEAGGRQDKVADVMEATMNRAAMKGHSLRQDLYAPGNKNFFGPIRHNLPSFTNPLSPKDLKASEAALGEVVGGRNHIEYRTDQGMDSDPGARRYNQMPDKSGRLNFGDGNSYFYMDEAGRRYAKKHEEWDKNHPSDTVRGVPRSMPNPQMNAGQPNSHSEGMRDFSGDRDAAAQAQAAAATDSLANLVDLKDHDPRGRALIAQYLKTGGAGMDPATVDWCAAALHSSLKQNGLKDFGNIANNAGRWGRDLKPGEKPQKGDLFYMDRGKGIGSTGGHAGFVEKDNEDGSYTTIEGNARVVANNPAYGHKVARGWRNGDDRIHFRRATAKELAHPELVPASTPKAPDITQQTKHTNDAVSKQQVKNVVPTFVKDNPLSQQHAAPEYHGKRNGGMNTPEKHDAHPPGRFTWYYYHSDQK